MTNRGVAPLDPETLVGQFRLLYGDTLWVELDPAEAGYGDYTELSDDEITMFLTLAGDSVPMAISVYFVRLAGDAAKLSKSVSDHDLSVDLTKRAADLRVQADYWRNVADETEGLGDIFEVVENSDLSVPAEAAPRWLDGPYVF